MMDPSRIVISKGRNRYVDEVYEEKEEPSHDEEMASGTSIREMDRDKATGTIEPTGETSLQEIPVVICVRRECLA